MRKSKTTKRSTRKHTSTSTIKEKQPKVKEAKSTSIMPLCLCGCGERTSSPKSAFRMGHDARYKSQLLNLATKQPVKLPSAADLSKRGYEADQIKKMATSDMPHLKATEVLATRGWSGFLVKRWEKLDGKPAVAPRKPAASETPTATPSARKPKGGASPLKKKTTKK